jgi:photosystem II stability/assembly factor-like uncharacterized protein
MNAQWRDMNDVGISESFSSIQIVTSMKGFVVGGNRIFQINPINPLWNYQELDSNTYFNSLTFTDTTNGFAVGFNSSSKSGIIVKTNDGGNNWSKEFQILDFTNLSNVFFINNTTGWVSGQSLKTNQAVIGKTTDSGTTWSYSMIPIIAAGSLNSIRFTDENTGWSVGTGDNSGFGKILKTLDGGMNWVEQPTLITGSINDVYFNDENVGWICTTLGEILKSNDGGSNWTLQYSANSSINSLRFINAKVGWAVGNGGLILRTTDGGLNWGVENAGINSNLLSISANNSGIVWICGSSGRLFTRELFSKGAALTPIIGTSSWGDYDNDGDIDLALTGVSASLSNNTTQFDDRYSEIHKNNGDGTFSKIPDQLIQVADGSIDWGDYDNDGDLDILIAGFYEDGSTADYIAKIYRNDNNDIFTEISANLIGFDMGYLQWGDLDNDGDLDIISSAGVFKNNGSDDFSGINQFINGAKAGDLDNDGDLDILSINSGLKIYVNEGNFVFTEFIISSQASSNPIDGNQSFLYSRKNSISNILPDEAYALMEFYGSAELGDFDSDGDLDILSVNLLGTKIFRNDGNFLFIELSEINLPCLPTGTGIFGDYDNDGDLDIFLTGGNSYNDLESGIYRNERNETFSWQPFYYNEFEIISWASARWGDYDNDGDLDLVVNGEARFNRGINKVFINNSIIGNNPPDVPRNLNSSINEQEVILSWNKSFDFETNIDGLNYNVVVGSTSGAFNIVSPMSNVSDGYRKIVNHGNASHSDNWKMKDLIPGRYYWKVQAIDNNFAGSLFSPEETFAIPYSIHNVTIPAGELSPVSIDSSLLTIQFVEPNSQTLGIYVERFNNTPLSQLPGNIESISNTYWNVSANSGNLDGVFSLIIDLSGIEDITDISNVHLLRRDTEKFPWIDLGSPDDLSNDTSAMMWSGLTSLSQFGLGVSSDPTPVELSSFTATLENNSIVLKWQTETELNNIGFEVERKNENTDWNKLGFIYGSGTSIVPRQYLFTDRNPVGGNKIFYRLKQIDTDGTINYTEEIEIQINPTEFVLHQNYPNPFNPITKIKFQLPRASKVIIKIYDILGAEVTELINEKKEAGVYEVVFNGQNLTSGTYIYSIISDDFSEVKKMIVLK